MQPEDAVRSILSSIGDDPEREGLKETPTRVVNAWKEWFAGYHQSAASVLKSFEDGAQNCNELVILDRIPILSFCEHHIIPFIGMGVVGYLPNGRIVGLSKIPRLVNVFARRLQVQERLGNQIADALMEHLQPKGVGVVLRCEHLCMSTRGVNAPGVYTTTSALRGIFLDPAVRSEFLTLARKSHAS